MRAWFKPFRFLAFAAMLFYISEPTSIRADALDSWHTNATFAPSGIAYGNGQFVAVVGSSLETSPDGTNWTRYIAPPVLHYEGITFGGGVFMAFGYPVSTNSSGPCYILESYDGIHWTNVYQTPVQITGAAFGNNQFVFVGSHIISTTLNPLQWTEFAPGITIGGVTYGDGQFITISGGAILSSTDGLVWQYDYSTNNLSLGSVTYGNGVFVATCRTNDFNAAYPNQSSYGYGFLVSSNLVSWQYVQLGNYYGSQQPSLAGIAFGGGYFVSAAYTNYGLGFEYTYTSTDGINWINRTGANGATLFAFGAGSFLASIASGNSALLQSGVFAPPTNPAPSSLAIATYSGVTIDGTVDATYQIQYTTNLDSAWLPLTNISLPYSPFIWVDTSSPIAGQRFYRSVQLQ